LTYLSSEKRKRKIHFYRIDYWYQIALKINFLRKSFHYRTVCALYFKIDFDYDTKYYFFNWKRQWQRALTRVSFKVLFKLSVCSLRLVLDLVRKFFLLIVVRSIFCTCAPCTHTHTLAHKHTYTHTLTHTFAHTHTHALNLFWLRSRPTWKWKLALPKMLLWKWNFPSIRFYLFVQIQWKKD